MAENFRLRVERRGREARLVVVLGSEANAAQFADFLKRQIADGRIDFAIDQPAVANSLRHKAPPAAPKPGKLN